uniref:hypothetical protein n=1 Tax=uncultured Draconibacterium sp. TaxID=1573823 RepID=UPI00321672EB
MKLHRYNIWAILTVLLLLVSVVLIFPMASDNEKWYRIVLYSSIGIVVILILFLIWTDIFLPGHNKKEVAD